MSPNRRIKRSGQFRIVRPGFLYLGALRELFVIGSVVGCVLALIWQTSLIFSLSSKSQQDCSELAKPVMGLSIDRDNSIVIALSWPGELKSISLETGVASSLRTPHGFISSVSSSRNMTTVMLAEWSESFQLHHRVDLVRQEELILSEEVIFETPTSASVFISADGQIAILLSADGHVIGWDLSETMPFRWEFQIGKTSARCSLSPDGRRLFISPSEDAMFLCDARTGANRMELGETAVECRSVEWSDDGRQLAVSDENGGIYVYEADSGQQTWSQQIDFAFVRSVAFSHDGTLLAAGGFDHTIRIWNLSKPADPPLRLTGQKGVIRALTFSPAETTLISGSLDGTIYEWSLASGQTIRRLQ